MGERNKRSARFIHAGAYWTFHLADFIYGLLWGSIALDFDCREAKPGSDGLRCSRYFSRDLNEAESRAHMAHRRKHRKGGPTQLRSPPSSHPDHGPVKA